MTLDKENLPTQHPGNEHVAMEMRCFSLLDYLFLFKFLKIIFAHLVFSIC